MLSLTNSWNCDIFASTVFFIEMCVPCLVSLELFNLLIIYTSQLAMERGYSLAASIVGGARSMGGDVIYVIKCVKRAVLGQWSILLS